MSAPVLLNLLYKLRKSNKMLSKPHILSGGENVQIGPSFMQLSNGHPRCSIM